MAGAKLLGLLDPCDPVVVGELRHHFFFAMADDHEHPFASRVIAGVEHEIEHRLAAHLVQHFRPFRLHPRALARGEDDGGQ